MGIGTAITRGPLRRRAMRIFLSVAQPSTSVEHTARSTNTAARHLLSLIATCNCSEFGFGK